MNDQRTAWLLGICIVAACGGDDPAVPDGASIDAPATDAPVSVGDDVRVSLAFFDGSPAGVPVIFHAPDGRVLAWIAADAGGVVTGPMEDGGMVTVGVSPSPNYPALFTFTDVHVGDQLSYDNRRTPPTVTPAGTLTVTVPPHQGANAFIARVAECELLELGTNQPSGPLAVQLDSRCVSGDTPFTVLGLAGDDTGFVAYTTLAGVTASAGAVTLPAFRTDWLDAAITLEGIDPAATHAGGAVELRAGDRPYFPTFPDDVTLTGGAARIAADVPRDVGDRLLVNVSVGDALVPDAVVNRQQLGRVQSPPGPSTIRGSDFLPRFDSVAVDRGDPARPIISWELTGEPTGAQLIEVSVRGPDWRLLVSSELRNVQIPQLPDELAARRPTATSDVIYINLADTGSTWDAIRVAWPRFLGPTFRLTERSMPPT